MKIGIDARMFGSDHAGLGVYVQQLLEHMLPEANHEFIIFVKPELKTNNLFEQKNCIAVATDIHWYGLKEHILFPNLIKQYSVDLMHFPHFNVPLFYRGPFVVTIHDLIMWHYPRKEATTHTSFVYGLKHAAFKFVIKMAAKRARRILVPSQYVKYDIASCLRVAEEKIDVTYLGVIEQKVSRSIDLKKYGITKKYILYVGNAYPHKNLERLIEAWSQIKDQHEEYQLVLAGKRKTFYDRLAKKYDLDEREDIILTDYIADEYMHALYKQASLFVFPSLSEGFGLPPLEAMQAHTPVVSSNAACMPEILGEGAAYFDPEDVSSMSMSISQVLSDKNIQFQLKQNARSELYKFSWKRCAERTLDVYKKALK